MATTFCSLVKAHVAHGQVDQCLKLYKFMTDSGLISTLSACTSLRTALANQKMFDMAEKIVLDMKVVGFSVDVNASDVLMIYIKEGSIEMADIHEFCRDKRKQLHYHQLFELCMKSGINCLDCA
jgi:pentatricopeptide repeat protein